MTARFEPPSPEAVSRVRREAERELTREEFNAYVNAPITDDELAEIHSLFAWFTRRYPTVSERFAWGRRAYSRALRAMPPGFRQK